MFQVIYEYDDLVPNTQREQDSIQIDVFSRKRQNHQAAVCEFGPYSLPVKLSKTMGSVT